MPAQADNASPHNGGIRAVASRPPGFLSSCANRPARPLTTKPRLQAAALAIFEAIGWYALRFCLKVSTASWRAASLLLLLSARYSGRRNLAGERGQGNATSWWNSCRLAASWELLVNPAWRCTVPASASAGRALASTGCPTTRQRARVPGGACQPCRLPVHACSPCRPSLHAALLLQELGHVGQDGVVTCRAGRVCGCL